MPSVRQYYPIKTRKHTSERGALVDEASRLVLSDGSVVKLMLDGSTRVSAVCFDVAAYGRLTRFDRALRSCARTVRCTSTSR